MIVWATIQDALRVWVETGSGLPAGKVIWSRQNAPRPDAPYIALGTIAIQRAGRDWNDVEDAAVPAPGAEIELKTRGVRTMIIQLQAFGGDPTGAASPDALLHDVMTQAARQSQRELFEVAGMGLLTLSDVQPLEGDLQGSILEPRAVSQATFALASEVTETATYIETVEVTNLGTGDTFVIP